MQPSESFTQYNYIPESTFNVPKLLNPDYLFQHLSNFVLSVFHLLWREATLDILHTFAYGFAMFFLTLIAYCAVRMLEIRHKEHAHLHHEIAEYNHHLAERERKSWDGDGAPRNIRWTAVLNHLFLDSLSDWKLAIIEADSMLEDLMTDMGFKGESLGDKLRSADRENFQPLSTAWEVHAIRNKIAHEGLAFHMSHHEAKRVIAQYEEIFRQFGYI